MTTRIHYSDIKAMLPQEAINHIQQLEKKFVRDFKVIDMLNKDALEKPFADTFYREVFPMGVYLFFDSNDMIRYVGQSAQGFFHRLMSHFDITPGGHWGWNALLRKMGGLRTGKKHHELSEKDHAVDFDLLKNYKLLLIEVQFGELSKDELKWLEKLIMKAFRGQAKHELLNTNIGWLAKHEWQMPIEKYLKG
ncbi:MAG: hypothetical protein U0T75_04635 [Chitinophagales bacterium]